jgi:RHS repeat-associated protein
LTYLHFEKDLIVKTAALNGKTSTVTHNVLTSQVTASSPLGRTVTSTYDPVTLLTSSVAVPGLNNTNYGYDTRGRLTSVTTGTRVTEFTYDTAGNLDTIEDPLNRVTSYDYDLVGRVTAIHRPDLTNILFDYDDNGNMTVLTTPGNDDHAFAYDNANLAVSYDPPVSNATQYVYDRDRRLTQKIFPSLATITNVYTGALLTQVQTPEGNIDLAYLASGQLESVTKGSEVVSYAYDGSLPTSVTQTGSLNQTLSYTYNNDFNVTGFTYAGGTSSFGYDNDGLLTSASGFTITRNANNGLPTAVTNTTLNLSRTFNAYGEVESQSSAVNSIAAGSYSLTYYANGQIATKQEVFGGVTTNYEYTYDSVGRLTEVEKDGVTVEQYAYTNGIRSSEINTLRGINRSLLYNNEDQLYDAGGVIYQYDSDGFLQSKTEGLDQTQYDYSSRGELLTVTLPNTTTVSFDHDPLGRRVAKRVNGAITEKYLWSGLTQLLAVYDSSNNLVMRFNYADSRMPVSMTTSGGTYYLTYDQVGSLRAVTDSSGTLVKLLTYDTFGNILSDSNPTFTVPFGFAGGLHDRDTGLVRFGFRDYDPEVGRWTAKDPIGFAGGDDDLYGYCLDNPAIFYDSKGLFALFENEDINQASYDLLMNGGLYALGNSNLSLISIKTTTNLGGVLLEDYLYLIPYRTYSVCEYPIGSWAKGAGNVLGGIGIANGLYEALVQGQRIKGFYHAGTSLGGLYDPRVGITLIGLELGYYGVKEAYAPTVKQLRHLESNIHNIYF